MAKCTDCGQEAALLHSIDRIQPERPGIARASGAGKTSEALCGSCFNTEAQKQGRPERVKEAS